jgi:hypothetical protein
MPIRSPTNFPESLDDGMAMIITGDDGDALDATGIYLKKIREDLFRKIVPVRDDDDILYSLSFAEPKMIDGICPKVQDQSRLVPMRHLRCISNIVGRAPRIGNSTQS